MNEWQPGRRARVLAAALASAAVLAGCDVAIGTGGKQFADDRVESAAVTAVRLAGGDGAVTLRRGSVSGVQIHRQVWYRHGRPQQRADRVEGSTLVLDTTCGRDCSFGYTVTLPAEVSVSGKIDTGPIDLNGVSTVDVTTNDGGVNVRDASGKVIVRTGTGPIDVRNAPSVEARTNDGRISVRNTTAGVIAKTGTGPIQLSDVKGDVDAATRDGHIDLTNVTGKVTARSVTGPINGTGIGGPRTEAQTADGAIMLRFSTAQDVEAHTGTGPITLAVPPAQDGYRVQTRADNGPIRVGIATVPSGGHLLNVSTKDGSITVRSA